MVVGMVNERSFFHQQHHARRHFAFESKRRKWNFTVLCHRVYRNPKAPEKLLSRVVFQRSGSKNYYSSANCSNSHLMVHKVSPSGTHSLVSESLWLTRSGLLWGHKQGKMVGELYSCRKSLFIFHYRGKKASRG